MEMLQSIPFKRKEVPFWKVLKYLIRQSFGETAARIKNIPMFMVFLKSQDVAGVNHDFVYFITMPTIFNF